MTVNTDNRLVTDTTVSKELWLCHKQMGFTLDDLKQIILSGFKSAFLPFHVKQQYLRRVSEELKAFVHEQAEESSRSLQHASVATSPLVRRPRLLRGVDGSARRKGKSSWSQRLDPPGEGAAAPQRGLWPHVTRASTVDCPPGFAM